MRGGENDLGNVALIPIVTGGSAPQAAGLAKIIQYNRNEKGENKMRRSSDVCNQRKRGIFPETFHGGH